MQQWWTLNVSYFKLHICRQSVNVYAHRITESLEICLSSVIRLRCILYQNQISEWISCHATFGPVPIQNLENLESMGSASREGHREQLPHALGPAPQLPPGSWMPMACALRAQLFALLLPTNSNWILTIPVLDCVWWNWSVFCWIILHSAVRHRRPQ